MTQDKQRYQSPTIDAAALGAIVLSPQEENDLAYEVYESIPSYERTSRDWEEIQHLIQQKDYQTLLQIQNHYLMLTDNSTHHTDNSSTEFNYIDSSTHFVYIDNSIRDSFNRDSYNRSSKRSSGYRSNYDDFFNRFLMGCCWFFVFIFLVSFWHYATTPIVTYPRQEIRQP